MEILIVLMILALIASITLVYLPGRQNATRLEVLAGDIALSLSQTRILALRSHQDAFFRMNLAERSYWQESATQFGPEPTFIPEGVEVEIHTAQSELESSTISAIRFFPDGSSTGGYIRIKTDNKAYRISVNWLTGRVESVNDPS